MVKKAPFFSMPYVLRLSRRISGRQQDCRCHRRLSSLQSKMSPEPLKWTMNTAPGSLPGESDVLMPLIFFPFLSFRV